MGADVRMGTAFCMSVMHHAVLLFRLRLDFSKTGLHTLLLHISLQSWILLHAGSLFLLGPISVKKQPLLGKIALLVLSCPSFLHILQNYISKGCSKATGLLFYLTGHFIAADPKPVSRSQNEWDFKSCSHPIVLRSIF